MNIPGGILILLVTAVLFKIHHMKNQEGGTLSAININNKYTEPYYSRQYRELDDVNNVLNRPVVKGKDNINTLQAWNTECDLDGKLMEQLKLREPWKRYLDFNDIEVKPNENSLKVLIEDKQPYFLDEALIIDYYGEKFYYDANYPKQPISVDFAKDPAKFCREHPNEYPSYIIGSRSSNLHQ